MAALASLLGLPFAPVISPLLLSARLSKDEARAATAAFHRARGHNTALDFARFRDSVLREAFVAMPVLLMRRVFVVWSYLENDEMSLKEFLVGVMIAAKGSRDEHLRFVFQLMDMSGTQELDRRDTLAFLAAVVRPSDGVVAIEAASAATDERSDRAWTVNEFADLLHPKAGGAEPLTPTRFVKTMRSKQFRSLLLVDWIAVFAMQFEPHPSVQQPKNVSLMSAAPPNQPLHNAQQQRRSLSPTAADASESPVLSQDGGSLTSSIVSPLKLSPALQAAIRSECFSILDCLVCTGETLTSDTFVQRMQTIVPPDVLETVRQVEALFPVPHSSQGSSTSVSAGASPHRRSLTETRDDTGRARFRHLVTILLSAFAHSADDLERLLFALFDDRTRDSLDVLQLATFLRFASHMTHAESERAAFSLIALLNECAVDRALSSPTASAAADRILANGETPGVTLSAFQELFRGAMPAKLELLAYTDIEVLHLLFHLQRTANTCSGVDGDSRARAETSGLKKFTKQLRLAKEASRVSGARAPSERFCLMERGKWNAIIAFVCDAAIDEAGAGTSDVDIDDAHDALANDVSISMRGMSMRQDAGVSMKEGADTELRADEVVLVPLLLWVMLSFWQRQKRRHVVMHDVGTSDWRTWTTRVRFASTDCGSDDDDDTLDSLYFRGFGVRVSLTSLSELDSAKEMHPPTVLQTIASEGCSVQDLVDAVLLQTSASWSADPSSEQPRRRAQRRTSIRECHLQLSSAALSDVVAPPSSENCSHSIPTEWLAMSLKLLVAMVLTKDAPVDAVCYLELQASIVQIDDSSQCHEATATLTASSKTPVRRSHHRSASNTGVSSIHGLANLGNTCFMNSALQCLVATPLLREYFATHEFLFDLGARYAPHTETVAPTKSSGSESSKQRVRALDESSVLPRSCLLPLAFGQLVTEMSAFSSTGTLSGVCGAIVPERMQRAIAMLFPHLSDGSQQDAQEFLSSLLSSLSDELQRVPASKSLSPPAMAPPVLMSESSSSILSPQSRAFLARLPSISRRRQESSDGDSGRRGVDASSALQHLRFDARDSSGRPDAAVANEWWIAHLIREPSIITVLFSGQFKSVLTCSVCGTKSVRFEPFSSLQLPIARASSCSSDSSVSRDGDALGHQHQRALDVVVVVHFARPRGSAACSALRLAVHVGEDWTLDQLLMKLQREYSAFGLAGEREYVACVVDGCRIVDIVDRDSLLATMPPTLDVFELERAGQRNETTRTTSEVTEARCHSTRQHNAGDELLVWTADDRFVRGVVTLVRPPSPHARTASLASDPLVSAASPASYDVVLREGLSAGRSMCAVSNVLPLSALPNRVLFLRLVHRRQVLVPFYCQHPQRLVLCGSPSVVCARAALLTGKALYRIAEQRFMPQRALTKRKASATALSPFVIRRVRDDGNCCQRCHWSTQCVGCVILRSNVVIDDLTMDETLAIDWDLDRLDYGDCDDDDPKDDVAWLFTQNMLPTQDHASYVQYRQTNTCALEQSLEVFCSSEMLEATCASCERLAANHATNDDHQTTSSSDSVPVHVQRPVLSPHTKELSLWSVPPVLVIQLKRFEIAPDSYAWRKVSDAVDFPLDSLDLTPFISADESYCSRGQPTFAAFDGSEDDAAASGKLTRAAAFLHTELNIPLDSASRDMTSYSLFGVVNHVGDIGSGHYTAHIKHPESSSDEWWLVDDAVGVPVDMQRLAPSSAAYLLFYVRHDLLPPRVSTANGASVETCGGATPSTHTPALNASQQYERTRLASLFPRQASAVRLSESAIRAVWQSEAARTAESTKQRPAAATTAGGSLLLTSSSEKSDACCIT